MIIIDRVPRRSNPDPPKRHTIGEVRRGAGVETVDLPEFSWRQILGVWEFNPLLLTACCVALTGYLVGVRALQKRGDYWAFSRSFSFASGIWLFVFATSSGLAAYDTTLLSVHMVQHMVLSMLVPLLVALGAPVTLALRALPAIRARRLLLAFLHSRLARVLTFAPLTLALYVLSPWALYFTGWYDATLESPALHELMHVHLVVVGALFFWPLLGVDPVPGRVAYPFRLLLILLTLPFHAFLGVTVMGQSTLIAGHWYLALREGPMGSWLPSAAADQHLAGGILWASGDLIGALLFSVLFVQWLHDSRREAIREDRRLDRLDARAEAESRSALGAGSELDNER
jgi:cytochrome c oxidase assembly factor CtaG